MTKQEARERIRAQQRQRVPHWTDAVIADMPVVDAEFALSLPNREREAFVQWQQAKQPQAEWADSKYPF